MSELNSIQNVVEGILIDYPEAREDDAYLYIRVCNQINPLAYGMAFGTVMLNREQFGLPNIESVGRCRRRLQEKKPELRASTKTLDARYEKWKEFRAYALQ